MWSFIGIIYNPLKILIRHTWCEQSTYSTPRAIGLPKVSHTFPTIGVSLPLMGCPLGPTTHSAWSTFKIRLDKKNSPIIPAIIIRTCHVGFQVDFPSIKNDESCSPKIPLCKPKAWTCDTLNQ